MASIGQVERLYDAHADALYSFLLNLTRNEDDTRDLMQDCFVKLAKTELGKVENERGFLLKSAYHQFIDLIRRRSSRGKYEEVAGQALEMFEESPDPDAEALRKNLASGLAALPDDQRAVVHLKLWEGFTFEQVAQTLEISPNTAASRYRYGLDKLRGELRPIYEELR